MEFSRVLWACRRGMLELDLLLGLYAKEVYMQLSFSKQADFDELLTQEDPVLWDWLMGKKEPALEFADLVSEIRAYAKD